MPEGVKVSIGNVYFFIGEPGSQDYLARITSFDHRGTIETKYYYCTTGSEMNPNSTTFCYHYYTPRIPTYEEDQKFLKWNYATEKFIYSTVGG